MAARPSAEGPSPADPSRPATARASQRTPWRVPVRRSLDKALVAASRKDPDCLRANLAIRLVLQTPEEVFARPGLRDKTLQLGSGWRHEQPPGPTREQFLALVSAQ